MIQWVVSTCCLRESWGPTRVDRANMFAQRSRVSGTAIETQVDAKSADFKTNSRKMIDRLTEIKNEEERIRQGGGAKAIESQHKKGRLTARERIAKLIDPKTEF